MTTESLCSVPEEKQEMFEALTQHQWTHSHWLKYCRVLQSTHRWLHSFSAGVCILKMFPFDYVLDYSVHW